MFRRAIAFVLTVLGISSTTEAAPGDPPPYQNAFSKAFERGWSVQIDDAEDGKPAKFLVRSFRTLDLGKLIITTGQICAADPFVNLGDTKPFTQNVLAGSHAVQLAVVQGGFDDGRVAFARVAFSEEPIVVWKQALVEGQDALALKTDEAFGYPVDAGTGSFYDVAAGQAASKMRQTDENVWEKWQTDGEANGRDLKPSFFLMLPADPGNIAMFASGWGDGFYSSWFGFDAQGKVAVLLTDFKVVAWDRAKP